MTTIFIKVKRPKINSKAVVFERICKSTLSKMGVSQLKNLRVKGRSRKYLVREHEVACDSLEGLINPFSNEATEYSCDIFVDYMLLGGARVGPSCFIVTIWCKDYVVDNGLVTFVEFEINPWDYFVVECGGRLLSSTAFASSNEALLGIVNNIVWQLSPRSIMLYTECEPILINSNLLYFDSSASFYEELALFFKKWIYDNKVRGLNLDSSYPDDYEFHFARPEDARFRLFKALQAIKKNSVFDEHRVKEEVESLMNRFEIVGPGFGLGFKSSDVLQEFWDELLIDAVI